MREQNTRVINKARMNVFRFSKTIASHLLYIGSLCSQASQLDTRNTNLSVHVYADFIRRNKLCVHPANELLIPILSALMCAFSLSLSYWPR